MKGFIGCLLLVLGTLLTAVSCNGANEVTGPDPGKGVNPVPVTTPHARPTPNPCKQNPADCD